MKFLANANRRDMAKAMLAGSAALAGPALAQPAAAGRTYVLVHGAFHGGWCWQRVASPCPPRGAMVPGCGSRNGSVTPCIRPMRR